MGLAKQTVTKFLLLALLIPLVAGCATTKITSVRDPQFRAVNYKRIIVWAPFTDLDKRATAENAFAVELKLRGVDAATAFAVLPPTRTYTNDDINAALAKDQVSGVLELRMTDYSVSSTYVPGDTTTTGSAEVSGTSSGTSYGTSYGNSYSGSSSGSSRGSVNWTETTRQDPGYYINKPNVAFEVKLVDVATGGTAWLATSMTRGNAWANWSTLMGSLASETVGKLVTDGVVRPVKVATP